MSQQYSVHSSNSYVATSIIMLQHSFSAASSSWCCDSSFHVATASLFRLCCNTILYYLHFCRDLESLSRHRLVAIELDLLFQLCFLCCGLDFCVGDVLHVTTPICYVETTLFYMQHPFLSWPSFFVRDITFMPLACLRVAILIFCRDRTFLCSADLCVET